MKKLIFFFTMFIICSFAFAQEEIQLKNGKTIIINPDGTWKNKIETTVISQFIDSRDGHIYNTVKIGTQIWMSDNLVFKMNSGCWAYKNNQDYIATYGYYYNWESAQKACPTGWHIPSETEWNALIKYLGGSNIAGDKLREIGNSHWECAPVCNATNSSGFNALPGGSRYFNGDFSVLKYTASWWSSTLVKGDGSASTPDNVKTFQVTAYNSVTGFNFGSIDEGEGYNIRCIKD